MKKNNIAEALRNFLVFFISIIVMLFLAETAIRVLNLDSYSKRERFLNPQDRFFFSVPINQKDPYLFWRLKPLASFGKISINPKGFRGKDFLEQKQAGSFRIIVLGDSCTLGVGIADKETYSSVLEKLLNKNSKSSINYEVINAGVAGYSSLQGLRFFKTELIKYNPDIITVQFGFNDYLYTGGPSDKDIPKSNKIAIYLDDIMGKSRFYRYLKKKLELLSSPVTMFPPNRRVDIEDYRKNLIEILKIARELGIKVILLNLPVRPEIPLVVNPIPIPRVHKNGKIIEWLRPAVIDGKSYFTESNFDGPTSVLQNSVKKYPQWALVHYFLARRYESMGEIEKAEEEFKKARETDEDRKLITEYNRVIKEIAEEMNIPMVDLVSLFGSKKKAELFLDERHTSALAHAIIAEELYKSINAGTLIE